MKVTIDAAIVELTDRKARTRKKTSAYVGKVTASSKCREAMLKLKEPFTVSDLKEVAGVNLKAAENAITRARAAATIEEAGGREGAKKLWKRKGSAAAQAAVAGKPKLPVPASVSSYEQQKRELGLDKPRNAQ